MEKCKSKPNEMPPLPCCYYKTTTIIKTQTKQTQQQLNTEKLWCGYEKLRCPKELKSRIIIWSSNSNWAHMAKRIDNMDPTDICTPMFIAILFTIVKRWKSLKCPLADEWINKMWSIRTGLKGSSLFFHFLWKGGNLFKITTDSHMEKGVSKEVAH